MKGKIPFMSDRLNNHAIISEGMDRLTGKRVTQLAVLALVFTLVATPVLALSLETEHSTNSDFNSGTTSGDVQVYDNKIGPLKSGITNGDFETGDHTGWTGDTGSFPIESGRAYEGTYGLEIGNSEGYSLSNEFPAGQYSGFEFYISPTYINGYEEEVNIEFLDSNGDVIIAILAVKNDGSRVDYELLNSDGSTEYLDGIPMDDWGHLTITNIDYGSNTFDISLDHLNGYSGGATGASFRTPTDDIASIRLNSDPTLYRASFDGFAPLGDSSTWPTKQQGSGTYTSANLAVNDADVGYINLNLDGDSSAEVSWQEYTDGTWSDVATGTYTTSGNYSKTLDTHNTDIRVRANLSNPDSAGDGAYITNYGVLGGSATPQEEVGSASPSDGALVESSPVYLSLNVSDGDFSSGDNVNVSFYNADGDEYIASDTVTTEGGEAKVEWDGMPIGSSGWYAILEDKYGNTLTTQTYNFEAPEGIAIRDIETLDFIEGENATVEVTFYGENTTEIKTTNNGQVSLAGLPSDEKYVVLVNVEGYHTRQIIIDDILEQNTAWMLNESTESVTTEFKINDYTQQYGRDTDIYVERPITVDNQTEWHVVAADEVGVAGMKTTLQQGQRYRISAVNTDGNTREFGGYTATVTESVPITIGELSWEVDDEDGMKWSTKTYNLTDVNPEPFGYVHFQYSDPSENTTDLNIIIHEQGNPTNEIYNETHAGPFGTFSLNESIEGEQVNNTTWVVKWSAQKDGAEIGASSVVSGEKYEIENPFDSKWAPAFLMGLLLFIAFMFGGTNEAIGGMVVASFAGVLWYLGWYTASGGVVTLALAVAVLGAIGKGSSR